MIVNTLFPLAVHSLILIDIFNLETPPPDQLKDKFQKEKVTSTFISSSTGSNAVIIRNVFSCLKDSGLINIAKGRGGTRLAMPPEEITLWDVFAAVEPTDVETVFKMHPNPSPYCSIGKNINSLLLPYFEGTLNAMEAQLRNITIKDAVCDFYDKMISDLCQPCTDTKTQCS